MLKLKLKTDKSWANLAENNLKELLIDHAFCEQKAASSAISLIVTFPELSDLVAEMSKIAQEEMYHFEMVHNIILSRGWVLGIEKKDNYVNKLKQFFNDYSTKEKILINKLLFSAMIEARSAERFKLLSKTLDDPELKIFYNNLHKSEALHYRTFINFAIKYSSDIKNTEKRWKDFLTFESEVISQLGDTPVIHG